MKIKLLHRTSRYFIAIIPPSPLAEELLELKNYFKEKYDSQAALKSPPHITLHKPFFWKDEKEDLLISSLNDFAVTQKPIVIELSNFSAFPPKVIFVRIPENEKLNELQCELQQFCETKLNLFDAESEDHTFHPHLTLAFRDLKRSMFLMAWEEFGKRIFSASFIMNKISLLKHNGKMWEPYKDFHF